MADENKISTHRLDREIDNAVAYAKVRLDDEADVDAVLQELVATVRESTGDAWEDYANELFTREELDEQIADAEVEARANNRLAIAILEQLGVRESDLECLQRLCPEDALRHVCALPAFRELLQALANATVAEAA